MKIPLLPTSSHGGEEDIIDSCINNLAQKKRSMFRALSIPGIATLL
jgi:hypothetical protein